MITKPRSSCLSRIDLGVGQSSIIDIESNSMPIPSELAINQRKPIAEAPNQYFSAGQWRPNCCSCSSTLCT